MTEPVVSLSSADSTRFGLRIGRARLDYDAGHHVLRSAYTDHELDLLILRLPAGSHNVPRALMDSGFRLVHADTLVYYAISLSSWVHVSSSAPDASITPATQADADGLRAVARSCFTGYRSHYHATPALDAQRVSEGYAEWAASYAVATGPGTLTYVVKCNGAVVGFVAASLDAATGICDVALNAVLPENEGRGLYREALGRLMEHARTLGFETGTISTQIWNYRVQRVWTRCGMHLTHAYDTYHVSRATSHSRATMPRGQEE